MAEKKEIKKFDVAGLMKAFPKPKPRLGAIDNPAIDDFLKHGTLVQLAIAIMDHELPSPYEDIALALMPIAALMVAAERGGDR